MSILGNGKCMKINTNKHNANKLSFGNVVSDIGGITPGVLREIFSTMKHEGSVCDLSMFRA